MSQISSKLRRAEDGYTHWCPGCEQMHVLPDTWQFNGNVEQLSFTPSFLHLGVLSKWTGEWKRNENGQPIPYRCHYILTDGVLNFQSDCTHLLVGQSVPLPLLPEGLTD